MSATVGRSSLLAWDVSWDREEPWRRFMQEVSGSRYEEYADSRRRLGISVERVWLVPRPSGGGTAVVYLEAEDRARAVRELAASKEAFDSWYGTELRRLFGGGPLTSPRVTEGELLASWRGDLAGARDVQA